MGPAALACNLQDGNGEIDYNEVRVLARGVGMGTEAEAGMGRGKRLRPQQRRGCTMQPTPYQGCCMLTSHMILAYCCLQFCLMMRNL